MSPPLPTAAATLDALPARGGRPRANPARTRVGLGLGVGATALMPSFVLACCTSALSGACAAAIQPNALAIINDSVDDAVQPAVTGKVFLGLTSSFVIVPALAGVLAANVHWRLPYFLMAAACFLTATLAVRLRVPRPPQSSSAALFSTFRTALRIPFMRETMYCRAAMPHKRGCHRSALPLRFRRRCGHSSHSRVR